MTYYYLFRVVLLDTRVRPRGLDTLKQITMSKQSDK